MTIKNLWQILEGYGTPFPIVNEFVTSKSSWENKYFGNIKTSIVTWVHFYDVERYKGRKKYLFLTVTRLSFNVPRNPFEIFRSRLDRSQENEKDRPYPYSSDLDPDTLLELLPQSWYLQSRLCIFLGSMTTMSLSGPGTNRDLKKKKMYYMFVSRKIINHKPRGYHWLRLRIG